jgi:hypothetical protein
LELCAHNSRHLLRLPIRNPPSKASSLNLHLLLRLRLRRNRRQVRLPVRATSAAAATPTISLSSARFLPTKPTRSPALAFVSAALAKKEFRWDTYTNSRGEFALRVPQGGEYEIVVTAKGFADQTNPVNAKSGISEDNVVYRMQPASGGKK